MGKKIKATLAAALVAAGLVGVSSPASAYGTCANKWESYIYHESAGNYPYVVVKVQRADGSWATIYEDHGICGIGALWKRPSTNVAKCRSNALWTNPSGSVEKYMTPDVMYGGSGGKYMVIDSCNKV